MKSPICTILLSKSEFSFALLLVTFEPFDLEQSYIQGILAQHGLILHGIRPTRFFFSFQFLAQHVYICPTRFFQILFFKTLLNRNQCQRRTPCSNPSHEKTWFLSDCNIQLGIPNQDQEVIVVMTIDKAPQILA